MNDWKVFVGKLVELGVSNSSSEIATVINRNSGLSITSQQVAGVKAAATRRLNK